MKRNTGKRLQLLIMVCRLEGTATASNIHTTIATQLGQDAHM